MRGLLIFLTLFAFMLGFAMADDMDEKSFGPNLLRFDKNVRTYHAGNDGIPRFVEGVLSEPALQENEAATVLEFFEKHRNAYKMSNPAEELKPVRQITDKLGMTAIKNKHNAYIGHYGQIL